MFLTLLSSTSSHLSTDLMRPHLRVEVVMGQIIKAVLAKVNCENTIRELFI